MKTSQRRGKPLIIAYQPSGACGPRKEDEITSQARKVQQLATLAVTLTRRSYGSLTAILALIYFGLIFALQYLLRGIINQDNDVAIVVSTLFIAALFQPLRHRVQALIDRRFYRRKYDAARTLAAFRATLRQEVDLATLSEHLVAVVQETMQPAHISLWLRKDEQRRKPNTDA
jgi:hypothetical protein